MTKSLAIALGGGGARGIAHIAVLEVLDEMGVRPTAIAGSSVGAMSAACRPLPMARAAAAAATTVLPQPTSPCTSLAIGCSMARSRSTSASDRA